MTSYFVSLKYKQTWSRPARLAIASLAAVITAGDHAGAANGRKERAAVFVESRTASEPMEPIMAVVSLRNQRITLYDAKGWILRAPVSSGASLACSALLAAPSASAARAAATVPARGCTGNRAGWTISTGATSLGATITRMPSLVMPNSRLAKSYGIRTQPCDPPTPRQPTPLQPPQCGRPP